MPLLIIPLGKYAYVYSSLIHIFMSYTYIFMYILSISFFLLLISLLKGFTNFVAYFLAARNIKEKFESNKRFCLIKRKREREREKRGAERGREIDEKREGEQKRIRLREKE